MGEFAYIPALDAQSGSVEETFNIVKGADDVFSAQDAVANDIGNILLTRFGNTPGDLKAKRGSTSEEAYRLYLQGIYLVEKEIWPI